MAMRSGAVDVPTAQRRMALRSQVRSHKGGEQMELGAGGALRPRRQPCSRRAGARASSIMCPVFRHPLYFLCVRAVLTRSTLFSFVDCLVSVGVECICTIHDVLV